MNQFASSFMATWAQMAFALFVLAIILSYQIEKRSPDLANRSGAPRFAMLFHTITNRKVARDRQTQVLRWIMLGLLAGVIALFVTVAFVVRSLNQPIL